MGNAKYCLTSQLICDISMCVLHTDPVSEMAAMQPNEECVCTAAKHHLQRLEH